MPDPKQFYSRPPVVAGAQGFYPSDPAKLTRDVKDYISSAETKRPAKPLGLIAPHAGYVFSGPVAGWAYRQIEGHSYDSVVVLSPSHAELIPFASVMTSGEYITPLGAVPVDGELADYLLSTTDSLVQGSLKGHLNHGWGVSEHALEVQLPFLQVALGDFKLVPIIVGDTSWAGCKSLAEGLAKVMSNYNVLIVASSDLSHYHSYNEAYARDREVIAAIRNGQAQEIAEKCQTQQLEACGGAPIAAMLAVAEMSGGCEVEILRHRTSGDVPYGSRGQVVGYMAAALYRK